MKPRSFLSSLCIACLFLFNCSSRPCSQETPGKSGSESNALVGRWTEICTDIEGKITSRLPDIQADRWLRINHPIEWEITREIIGMQLNPMGVPQSRFSYQLNPGGLKGAIDCTYLPDKEDKVKPKRRFGIYFVRDDYLLLCFGGDVRPKKFSGTKENGCSIFILRKGKLIK